MERLLQAIALTRSFPSANWSLDRRQLLTGHITLRRLPSERISQLLLLLLQAYRPLQQFT